MNWKATPQSLVTVYPARFDIIIGSGQEREWVDAKANQQEKETENCKNKQLSLRCLRVDSKINSWAVIKSILFFVLGKKATNDKYL